MLGRKDDKNKIDAINLRELLVKKERDLVQLKREFNQNKMILEKKEREINDLKWKGIPEKEREKLLKLEENISQLKKQNAEKDNIIKNNKYIINENQKVIDSLNSKLQKLNPDILNQKLNKPIINSFQFTNSKLKVKPKLKQVDKKTQTIQPLELPNQQNIKPTFLTFSSQSSFYYPGENRKNDLKDNLNFKEKELFELRRVLEENTKELSQLQIEKSQNQIELSTKISQIEALNLVNKEVQKNLDSKINENVKLLRTIKDKEKSIKNEKNEKEELENELKVKTKEIQNLNLKIKENEEKIQNLSISPSIKINSTQPQENYYLNEISFEILSKAHGSSFLSSIATNKIVQDKIKQLEFNYKSAKELIDSLKERGAKTSEMLRESVAKNKQLQNQLNQINFLDIENLKNSYSKLQTNLLQLITSISPNVISVDFTSINYFSINIEKYIDLIKQFGEDIVKKQSKQKKYKEMLQKLSKVVNDNKKETSNITASLATLKQFLFGPVKNKLQSLMKSQFQSMQIEPIYNELLQIESKTRSTGKEENLLNISKLSLNDSLNSSSISLDSTFISKHTYNEELDKQYKDEMAKLKNENEELKKQLENNIPTKVKNSIENLLNTLKIKKKNKQYFALILNDIGYTQKEIKEFFQRQKEIEEEK